MFSYLHSQMHKNNKKECNDNADYFSLFSVPFESNSFNLSFMHFLNQNSHTIFYKAKHCFISSLKLTFQPYHWS